MRAGIPSPPPRRHPTEETPPGGDPPEEAHPPQEETPQHAGRYAQRAGGTHPTGMQSCLYFRASATHDLGLYDIVDESFRDLNGAEKPGSDGTFEGEC